MAEQVTDVLKTIEVRLVHCINWHGFRRCAAAAHPAVIVALRLHLDGAIPACARRQTRTCRVRSRSSPAAPRRTSDTLAAVRVNCVVFPEEVKRLPQILVSVALSDGRLLLRECIRSGDMYITLKRALLGRRQARPDPTSQSDSGR